MEISWYRCGKLNGNGVIIDDKFKNLANNAALHVQILIFAS